MCGPCGGAATSTTGATPTPCTVIGWQARLSGGRTVRYLTEGEARAAMAYAQTPGDPVKVCR